MDITKETGEIEAYDPEKLCQSIKDAGAPDDVATRVCGVVDESVEPGMSTTKIFRNALNELVKEDVEVSARYSLRRGLNDLGPTGFLFEQYIEAVLQAHGYETERNVIAQGECVTHEIDIFAQKDGIRYLVEAKYRNEIGGKTHIDQVMYADARLMDIERHHAKKGHHDETYVMWVITNTKFTKKAINYAKCRKVKLAGWNYPKKENLRTMIVEKKMYPLTVLPSMTTFARDQFAANNMVLAQDLLPHGPDDLVKNFGLSKKLAESLAKEAQALLAEKTK